MELVILCSFTMNFFCENFLERFKASRSQHLVSKPKSVFKESSMVKKITDGRELAAPVPYLKLSKTNYCVWSMAMEVYLDSHDLWQEIVGENASKKKDSLALSGIISVVPEDLLVVLDAKKMAKEIWEIMRQRNLGVKRVIQSCIQGLKQDFEMLTMAKTNSFVDFVIKFMLIVSD